MSDIVGEDDLAEPPLPQEPAVDPAAARNESGAGSRTTFAVVITSYN